MSRCGEGDCEETVPCPVHRAYIGDQRDIDYLVLNLKDAIRLLEDALLYGRSLHPTGCNCVSGSDRGTCFSCEVRERIKFGKAALETVSK